MIEIKIDGVVSCPIATTEEQFWDEFIEWIESKDYNFGGYIGLYKDEEVK